MLKFIKSAFTFLLFMFTFISISFAQTNQLWKWMHPKPQGNALRYVKAVSSTNWIAIGYSGTFMKTTDAGVSWTIYTNAGGTQAWGQGRTLYSGWFFDANTGIVCGSGGWIARTTNGGVNWDSIGSSSTSTMYGIHFINNNTGFIGCYSTTNQVYKTTNGGVSWTGLPTAGSYYGYNMFAFSENNLYCPASSGGNLLISTNGGANWTVSATGASTLYDANFISTSTGFVCGSSGNVRLTTNGGTSWTGVNIPVTSSLYELKTVVGGLVPSVPYSEGFENAGFPPAGWRAVSINGPVVWVRSTAQYHSGTASAFVNYDCAPGGGLDWLITPQWSIVSGDSLAFWMRTQDYGYIPDSVAVRVSTTDTALSSFTTRILYLAEGVNYPAAGTWKRYAASLNPFAGQNIYIGFKHGDNCGDGIYLDDIAVNRLAPSITIYAIGDAMNIYRSTNLGTNWTAMNHLDPAQPWTSTWYSMDISGSNFVAVGANGLINKSTNNGANWTTLTSWLGAGTYYDVWAEYNDKKVWAVGSSGATGSNDQIIYSANGGISWVTQPFATTRYYRSISMVNASTGYIAGSSGAVRKTTNGGAAWDSLPFPATSLLYKADFVNASTGWVVGSSSPYVWKTTDGGLTWPSQTGPTAAVYCIDMVDINTGWFAGSSGSVFKTTNGGTTWTAQTSGSTSTLYGVHMLNVNTGFICGSSSALLKTTNGGTNWVTIAQPYSTTLYGMDWFNVNAGIVTGSSGGYTARTTNGGASWAIENTSGSTMYSVCMRDRDSAWAVGSGAYVFKLSTGFVGITNYENIIPKHYYLAQNYPNPFNPVTTIKFGLPKASKVTFNVYDITGRLVASVLNNAPLNAGTITHNFDGTDLASGIYFYSLIVNDEKFDTKKMILVK